MKTPTPKEFLDAFLADRVLEAPDGRLLRDYECGNREYRSLTEVLDRAGRPDHLRHAFAYGVPSKNQQAGDDYDLVMPAFVLYGSEWFRRDWDGKRRKVWRRLMQGIGWSDSEYWELYPAMASGLGWLEPPFHQAHEDALLGDFRVPQRRDQGYRGLRRLGFLGSQVYNS